MKPPGVRWASYARAFGLVAAGLLTARLIDAYATVTDEAMISLLTALLTALLFDVEVSIAATLVNILGFDFFLIPPRFELAWSDLKNGLTFVAIFVAATVVSSLSQRLRRQEQVARRRARFARALYELNVELSAANQPSQLSASAERHIARIFSAEACVLLRSPEGWLEPHPRLDPDAAPIAEQAWRERRFRGGGVGAGPNLWVPIEGIQEVLGVVGISAVPPFEEDSEPVTLLLASARELGTALERAKLARAVHRSQVEIETERMRNSLLSSVSHDLKTPLSSIIAAAATLRLHRAVLEGRAQDELLSGIVAEGERLHRMVQNLLSISRLESPTIELHRTPEPLEEIVAAALDRFDGELSGRAVCVEIPNDLPWVLAEPALVDQVFSNLIENVIRYTDAGVEMSISARVADEFVLVQVADRGPGLPQSEWDKVFEKYYRGPSARRCDGGAGIGLTICRAIVRAHGGTISLRGRPEGGTLVEFTLPIAPSPEGRWRAKEDAA